MNKASPQIEKNATHYNKVGRKVEVLGVSTLAKSCQTQQQVADQAGVPRTTLQSWVYREQGMKGQIDTEVVDFYESVVGLSHLHRILTAATYTFHKVSGCGIPTIRKFLELSQLNQFVASSIGTLGKISQEMDSHIIVFGTEETEHLGREMARRKITVVADETFLPGAMILVMMDPVSNFILAEEIKKKRDTASWNEATASILKQLNVEVIQLGGDEGSGLSSFAANILKVHKTPDLFHVQQDITKAVGSYLARATQTTEKEIKESSKKITKACNQISKGVLSNSDSHKKLSKDMNKFRTAEKKQKEK